VSKCLVLTSITLNEQILRHFRADFLLSLQQTRRSQVSTVAQLKRHSAVWGLNFHFRQIYTSFAQRVPSNLNLCTARRR
jgi:hypothetical protein